VLIVVALASGVATVVAAGSSGPSGSRAGLGDPVAFLKRVVREIAANQYGRAWETLDPVQQALVPKTEYVRCEWLSPIRGRLTSIQVIALRDQPIRVAGSDANLVQSKAVTLRLTITGSLPGERTVITDTAHAVSADDRWAWILPSERLALHLSGTCRASETPASHAGE
jgi:hypothetical protein